MHKGNLSEISGSQLNTELCLNLMLLPFEKDGYRLTQERILSRYAEVMLGTKFKAYASE